MVDNGRDMWLNNVMSTSETLTETSTETLTIALEMAREWEMWDEAEDIWRELKARQGVYGDMGAPPRRAACPLCGDDGPHSHERGEWEEAQ